MELTLNRVAAGLVGVAMVAGLGFAFAAERAHAVTLSELVELFIALDVIPADKAEEARAVLQGQGAETPETPSLATSMSCSFTRNLTVGDTGQDVMDLQKLLNAKGFMVSAAGAGAPGQETTYFGPATKGAVAAMQTAFASEILAPLGLTTGTGFFGASTRAKANALCSVEVPETPETPDVPELPGDEDEEDMDEEEDDVTLSGEASLDTTELNSADDDEIEEGAEDATVAELTLEFSDGDAMITRLDVSLVADDDGNDETDPWDVFETVSLWVDGDMVAEKDIDSKSDYLDEDDGTVRFTGLDIVGMEDEELDIVIAVTVAGSVDGSSDGAAWDVNVDSIRFVDGDDVTSTENLSETAVGFTIDEAGAEDELIVKTSTSDPDSSIIKVESDSKSDWVTVFVFDIDTDDSVSDITINDIPVSVNVAAGLAYSDLVDDARLVIDGTTIDSTLSDVTNPASTTVDAVITFDVDGDVVIDAGDRVKAELQLRFKPLAPANEGATVQGLITGTNVDAIDAEGADDLGTGQLDGSATGDEHQLLTEGVYAEIVSVDESTTVKDGVADTGTFVVKFDVTAFEKDYFINNVGTRATGSVSLIPATGAIYEVVDAEGNATTSGAVSAVLSATADEETNEYKVNDGETETFTLTVTFTPDAGGVNESYRVELLGLIYSEAAAGAALFHTASPDTDFRTGYVNIGA